MYLTRGRAFSLVTAISEEERATIPVAEESWDLGKTRLRQPCPSRLHASSSLTSPPSVEIRRRTGKMGWEQTTTS